MAPFRVWWRGFRRLMPTRSVLSTRAGRAPLVLVQLLLFRFPLEFKFHALVVLFVFGERGKN